MRNSDIIGCNSIYFQDQSGTAMEGIQFSAKGALDENSVFHSLWCTDTGTLKFTPNRNKCTEGTTRFSVDSSGAVVLGTSTSTSPDSNAYLRCGPITCGDISNTGYITNSSKVGIGILLDTSSAYKLGVNGTSYFTGNVGIGTTPDTSNYKLKVLGNSYFDGGIKGKSLDLSYTSGNATLYGPISCGDINAGGVITARSENFVEDHRTGVTDTINTGRYGINMNNSDIIGCNSIYFKDACDSATEGIHFMYSNLDNANTSTIVHSLWCTSGGTLTFTPSRKLGTKDESSKFSVDSSGKVSAATFVAKSDKRLKENITKYECEKSILDLPVYEYNFISDENKKIHIGCLAQDLQEICPEIVQEGSDGYLSINESKIVYLLLEEVKKLREEVDELKNGG